MDRNIGLSSRCSDGCVLFLSAFAAYDKKEKQSGALIEWFFFPQSDTEVYTAGGDFCQQYIPYFDRKKGKQHNFETVAVIFEDLAKKYSVFKEDWREYWAKAFVFDALIGNTDRHQDNWGIIETFMYVEERVLKTVRISPVFDNGTSMGYNILPRKFKDFESCDKLEKYFLGGWHHMKWSLDDEAQLSHSELLIKFSDKYPETRRIMVNCLKKLNFDEFKKELERLSQLEVPVKLSAERAHFVLRLLQFRHLRLLNELDNSHEYN